MGSYLVGVVDRLQFPEGVDFGDVPALAGTQGDLIMVLAYTKRYLLPEPFFPSGKACGIGQVDGQHLPACRIPVGDAHHLPGVETSQMFGLDDAVIIHGKAPVVGAFLEDGKEIGLVMVQGKQRGGTEDQVRLEDVGVGKEILRHQSAGDVVGFIEQGIVQEPDHRVFGKQLVELVGKIAPDHVDFLDAERKACIDQPIDDPDASDPNQRFGRVEGDRSQTGAEACR